ncbi:MAG: sugar phosphate isomerase/epimerase family protein [Armatimonadota bacterium]
MRVQNHQIGVQSWCFRTYKTHEEIVQGLRACGLDALELCGVHLDVTDPAAVEQALACYRENGITITAFGVAHFPNDETVARSYFNFAKAAGFPTLSAAPDPDAFPLLERLCDEYGVKLAIHNHGRKDRYGSVAQLADAFSHTSPNIGLCLDTAWMLDAGENPLAVAERFADRLYGLHIKDFIFQPDGSPVDVVVGTGNLPLAELFATLKQINFHGYTTLEYEGDPENPVPSLQQCVEQLRTV